MHGSTTTEVHSFFLGVKATEHSRVLDSRFLCHEQIWTYWVGRYMNWSFNQSIAQFLIIVIMQLGIFSISLSQGITLFHLHMSICVTKRIGFFTFDAVSWWQLKEVDIQFLDNSKLLVVWVLDGVCTNGIFDPALFLLVNQHKEKCQQCILPSYMGGNRFQEYTLHDYSPYIRHRVRPSTLLLPLMKPCIQANVFCEFQLLNPMVHWICSLIIQQIGSMSDTV